MPGARPTRPASDGGTVALVSTAVRALHTSSRSAGPTSSGAISMRGCSPRAGDELDEVRPPRRIGAEGGIEAFDRPAGQHLGPQLALLGVLQRRVDGDDRGTGALEAVAGVEEHLVDLVRVGHRQAFADVPGEGLAQLVGDRPPRR